MKSCKNAELPLIVEGKKTKVKGYEVILENTILFPEGGGQVCIKTYIYLPIID